MNEIDKNNIIKKYEQGKSILAISKEFSKYSYYTIHKNIKDSGVEIRDNGAYATKYTYNENCFLEQTEESAYWLGFLLADGSYNKELNQVKLDLGIVDIEHLKKLQKFLGTNKPINIYTNNYNKEYCRLVIANKKICGDLVKLGLVERKTAIVEYPKLDSKMNKHFIRGYIDADGSIKKNCEKDGLIIYKLFIIGTDNILENILKNIPVNSNFSVNPKKRKASNPNKGIEIGGKKQLKNVITYIYENSSVFLDRKMERASYIMKNY